MPNFVAKLVSYIGRAPLAGGLLRRIARHYPEGSVVAIRWGEAKGLLWRRHHRYVNGYWVGVYELPLQHAISNRLSSGKTFFDVGANAGFFTLVAAKVVGASGNCVAFEPLPKNAESVLEQLELNGFNHCHLVQKAVASECGLVNLSFSSDGDPTAHLVEAQNESSALKIQATTLDEAFKAWGAPNLIKLDVEGAEAVVVEGAKTMLAACHPTWIIELHGSDQELCVKELLSRYGYQFTALEGCEPKAEGEYPRHVVAQ